MAQPLATVNLLSLISIKQAILEQLDLPAQQGHQALLVQQDQRV
jgi:hypothetical protein